MTRELSKDVSGRKVLFGVATKHDRYLTHMSTVRAYGMEYAQHGIQPVALDLSADDGPVKFSQALSDPACLGAHCEQGWGLGVKVPWEGQQTSVFEILAKPAVSHIRDMPYSPWLRETCFGKAPWAHLSFADRDSAELLTRVNGTGNRTPKSRFHSHVYFDLPKIPSSETDLADRSISCLYVGSYQNPQKFKDELNESFPQWVAPLTEAFEAAKEDFHTPTWEHGERIAKEFGFEANFADDAFLDFIFLLNQMVRMERRRSLLERLAKHPIHLVWSGDRPDIELHPDTVILEPTTFPESVQLMGQSKAMVMSLNSFSAALSERLLSAMRQKAVVLTHPNQLIDETFTPGTDILTFGADQESLDEAIAQLGKVDAMDRLRTQAYARIDEAFHPRHIVRDHLQAMIDFEDALSA